MSAAGSLPIAPVSQRTGWVSLAILPQTETAAASRGPARPQLRVRSFVTGPNAPPNAPPTSSELLRDSNLAALSGLAYLPPGDLSDRLQQHGLDLQVGFALSHLNLCYAINNVP